jgi:hypothetical protein
MERRTGVQLPSPPPPHLLAFDEGEMRFFGGKKDWKQITLSPERLNFQLLRGF